ncbi:Down syndrome cell adhesion molecule [Schistosoma japonicum]|nr:Down syndrome cell adhesion molecule [Schistosoma japonicum]
MRGRYSRVHCSMIIRHMDHEITGLPKFTAYAFRVIAMNSKGLSPPAYTQARTLEDYETSSVNQAVKGQTTVTLAGLLAYTNYTIQVAVSNRKGRGPASPRIICLTKEAPPGAPEFVKVKPINSSCIVVSWSHPRKPQGQMKSYCLEAIPLLDTAQDGLISLFQYPPLTSASSSSYGSNNNNERAKGPCIRPDFSNSYNYYFYCGLVEERPYNISVRGINQFDGHKAWAGPVRPTINQPPRKPIWHKFTPSLRGIQAEWLSPGSKRLDAPILWFYLNWTNLHTGEMETIRLSSDQRTYYLSNLTCATTVKFQLKAENKVGNSSLTDVTSWTTLGSAPLTANAVHLIPNSLRQQYSVTFNLSSFLPGNGCPPNTYRLLIAPSEDGHFGEPMLRQTHLLGKANFFQQPTVIVPIAALFAVILVVAVALILFCRHRRLEEDLCPNKNVTVTHNDLRPNQINDTQHSNVGHSYHSYHVGADKRHVTAVSSSTVTTTINSGKGRSSTNHGHDHLPPIPSLDQQRQSNSQAVGRHGAGLKSWFNGSRIRHYDRGHAVKSLENSVHIGSGQIGGRIIDDEVERLSTNSVDSEGNINPYATYAATGFGDPTDTVGTSVTLTGPGVGAATVKSSVVSASVLDGLSIPSNPDSMITTLSGHHYHYPNLDSSIGGGSSTLSRPHLIRVGSSGRLALLPQHMIDPRLIPPSTAALIDPMMLGPYDNGTLEGGDSEGTVDEFSRSSVLGSQTYHQGFAACIPGGERTLFPIGLNASRSVVGPNVAASFYESSVGGVQASDPSVAYRGSVLSSTTVSSNHEELMQAYEYGRKHQLRSCLTLPSNTVLPPQLMPVNVGARLIPTHHHMNMRLDHQHHQPYLHHHSSTGAAVVTHPTLGTSSGGMNAPGIRESEISGESGSSEATDSGIRQFTQQPPQPDEARHAACEIPFVYDANQLNSRRIIPVTGVGASLHHHRANDTSLISLSRTKSGNRLQQSRFIRCDSDCPSDMTDTYATVDYNNGGGGVSGVVPPYNLLSSTQQNSIRGNQLVGGGGLQKSLYGYKIDGNVVPRSYQPLPAPPTLSTIGYCDSDQSAAYGGPTTCNNDEVDHCQQTSFYYQRHHHPSSTVTNLITSGTSNNNKQSISSSEFINNSITAPLSHKIIGLDSSQMRRRALPISMSANNRGKQDVCLLNICANNQPLVVQIISRQLDRLHSRQLSEITGEETVGLLSATASNNSQSHDVYNSTVHSHVYGTTTTATTTTTGATNVITGVLENANTVNMINSSNGLVYPINDTSGIAYQRNTSSHQPESTEENVYTSEFVLV